MADYYALKAEAEAAVSHIGSKAVNPYKIEWLGQDQRKRLNATNFMTNERWQFRLLAKRSILVEISYGDFLGGAVLGLTVFHRDPASREWDHERSKACHSIAELVEALEVLNKGREAVA